MLFNGTEFQVCEGKQFGDLLYNNMTVINTAEVYGEKG